MKIDETWGYDPQEVALWFYVLDFVSAEIVGKLGGHENRATLKRCEILVLGIYT